MIVTAPPLLTPLATLRTAAWTLRALRRTRAALARTGRPAALPVAPMAPTAYPVVLLILACGRAKCLSRSAVRQAWLTAQGDPRDLVIGVTAPSNGFRAHAWLDGDRDGAGFAELSRSALPAAAFMPQMSAPLKRDRYPYNLLLEVVPLRFIQSLRFEAAMAWVTRTATRASPTPRTCSSTSAATTQADMCPDFLVASLGGEQLLADRRAEEGVPARRPSSGCAC